VSLYLLSTQSRTIKSGEALKLTLQHLSVDGRGGVSERSRTVGTRFGERGFDRVEALEEGRQLGWRARRRAPNDGHDPAHRRSSVGADPADPAVHPVRVLR